MGEWNNDGTLASGASAGEPVKAMPTLAVRLDALNRLLDEISDVLSGENAQEKKHVPLPISQPASLEALTIGTGEMIDKAYSRLVALRIRLQEHMGMLR
jgi:hypothetical protein